MNSSAAPTLRAITAAVIALALGLGMLPLAPALAYPRPGRTEWISATIDGAKPVGGTGVSFDRTSVSGDGRYIAFSTDIRNILSSGRAACSCRNVFVRDRATGAVTHIAVSTGGDPANADSMNPSISADGRYVGFESSASNLVGGDTNDSSDVFVHDRDADGDGTFDEPDSIQTSRVSLTDAGLQANSGSTSAAISADGRQVAFVSQASNLTADDTAGNDVFVRDRVGSRTIRIGTPPRGTATRLPRIESNSAISRDGRHVVFQVGTGGSSVTDVYVHDRDSDGNGVFDETGATATVHVTDMAGTATTSPLGGSISGDGRYVAFHTEYELVANDNNQDADVYVRDRDADQDEVYDEPGEILIRRVSVTSAGREANGASMAGEISGDGRRVAFVSASAGLVAGDSNRALDVFVHDIVAGTTERASVASDGSQANADSPYRSFEVLAPALNDDGAIVAFASRATNLVPDYPGGSGGFAFQDVFVRQYGPALGLNALEATYAAGQVAVSATATFSGEPVTTSADPRNDAKLAGAQVGAELVGASVVYRPEQEDLFARLRVSEIPRTFGGALQSGVGMVEYALELTVGQTRYRATAATPGQTRAGPTESTQYLLSRCDTACLPQTTIRGSFGAVDDSVTLQIPLTALAAGEGDALTAVRAVASMVAASSQGPTELDEVALDPVEIPKPSIEAGIAPRAAALDEVRFSDISAGLVDGSLTAQLDAAGLQDGYYALWAKTCLAERCSAQSIPLKIGTGGATPTPTPTSTSTSSPSPIVTPTASPTPTPTPSLDPPSAPSTRPRTRLISVTDDGTPAKQSSRPAISADGRYIAFDSRAKNLEKPETDAMDVFISDTRTEETVKVSVATDGTPGNASSFYAGLSADGRFVVFKSQASNLVDTDTNGTTDVFVHDRDADSDGVFDENGTTTTERVSIASDGTRAGVGADHRVTGRPSISPDGRYVLFGSSSPLLVEGDTNGASDAFLHDRETAETRRISVSTDEAEGNSDSYGIGGSEYYANGDRDGGPPGAAISGDGRHVIFTSAADNLVPGDTNQNLDVFVRDLELLTTERISVSTEGTQTNNGLGAADASMSFDGRFVVFESNSQNLVPVDTPYKHRFTDNDIYVRDRDADEDGVFDERGSVFTRRVSVSSTGAETDEANTGYSYISPDGRYVVFHSFASTLVEGDDYECIAGQCFDVFVHDIELGLTERVSVGHDGAQGNEISVWGAIDADGRNVTFMSFATNLLDEELPFSLTDLVYLRDRGPVAGVGDGIAVLDGDEVKLSGWTSFHGDVLARASDPSDDSLAASALIGAELTDATLAYRPARGDLLARLQVDSLPVDTSNGLPLGGSGATVYGFELTVEGTTYQARATALEGRAPSFDLYECAAACLPVATLDGSYGTTGNEVQVAIPLEDLGIDDGTPLGRMQAFTAVGSLVRQDEIALDDAAIPSRRLLVGTAPVGTPQADVSFEEANDSLDADGAFETVLDVSGLAPGRHDVWMKGCLGAECRAVSRAIVIDGAEKSPTSIAFTNATPTAGQFSDATVFEARLVDAAGAALAGEDVVFTLTGAAESFEFTSVSDKDGLARITPALVGRPGEYQLTVRYDGDPEADRGGSADTRVFSIQKEDTALWLSVEGNGNRMELVARLADADTPSAAIARRTVIFWADGSKIGEAATNNDGVARLSVPSRNRGSRTRFEATFEGDDFYLAVADEAQRKDSGSSGTDAAS